MYCASLAGSFWVVSAVLGVFFGVFLVIIVSCTLRARCMSCASVLCSVFLYYVLYHCIMLSVQDVLCLCGALAGADNGFPRLTWRAAALLIRLAVIIVIIVIITIIIRDALI